MKLPDLPAEEPKAKAPADEAPRKGPKVVVHRGGPARRPGDEERKPAGLFGTRPTPHPAPEPHAQAAPPPAAVAEPAETNPAPLPSEVPPPEPPSPTDNPPRPRNNGRPGKGINPGLRLRAVEAAARTAPPAKIPFQYLLRPNRELARKAYWDVAAALSLVVNAILIGVLVVMAFQIRNLKTTVDGLLGGLYGNFVELDNAKISTTIAIDTQIPLNFNLPVAQDTEVTLTQAVAIPGAWVVINSGPLSINSAANVTLPAGTRLPIALNTSIPVQINVPVSLQVPVNIPLNQTGLHAPFQGLQQTIRPLYCSFNRNAQYPQGVFICTEHEAPTPGTP